MARSFFDLMQGQAERIPEQVAALYKRQGAWRELPWRELAERADALAAGLVGLGVAAGERVAILSNTRVEWSIADLGIVGAGAVTVPIYQSNTPAEVAYILQNSGAVMVITEDAGQLAKVREVWPQVPGLRAAVCFDGAAVATGERDERAWDELLADGARRWQEGGETRAELEGRRGAIAPDGLATLIYTSGTTGQPKGVQITHANLLAAAEAVAEIGVIRPADTQLLFLPLAHSFAKLLEMGWLATGSILAYAESIDKLIDNMPEVKPTLMASVPRVFEKVHAATVSKAVAPGGLKGKLARWALAKGEQAARAHGRGEPYGGLGWILARKLVFAKIGRQLSARFGGRLRFFVSGGAPLSPEIAYFFRFAGIEICEGYGLTETNSITTFNRPGQSRVGTVGPRMPGVELQIAADGEILVRGPIIFAGYWHNPEATAEVLSEDGWFATGDIGELDPDGHLRITDRKKDLIVTAGGKNVAPQYIENLLKSRSPLISQVVVYGDRKPYLVALVTLDEGALRQWGERSGAAGSAAELSRRPEVWRLVEEEVKVVNGQLPSYETLKAFAVLDHDFVVGDQLTPTLKVRRKVVSQRYGDVIEGLYAEGQERRKAG